MQQKYCDHGRSTAVSKMLADVLRAQFLRLRREAEERVDLALDEQIFRLFRRIGDPAQVFLGIEPDLGRH